MQEQSRLRLKGDEVFARSNSVKLKYFNLWILLEQIIKSCAPLSCKEKGIRKFDL